MKRRQYDHAKILREAIDHFIVARKNADQEAAQSFLDTVKFFRESKVKVGANPEDGSAAEALQRLGRALRHINTGNSVISHVDTLMGVREIMNELFGGFTCYYVDQCVKENLEP